MCRIKIFKVNKQERIKKISDTALVLSCVLFLASTAIRMYFYNDLAVKNRDLKGAFDNQSMLEQEIALLKIEESELSSMPYVETQAVKLGFIPMNERLMTLDTTSSGQVASISR